VLRPVFRGLRPAMPIVPPEPDWAPCSAETRFQGIATGRIRPRDREEKTPACSAETRFQGIATGGVRHTSRAVGWNTLAVLRPVFRGLRRAQLAPIKEQRGQPGLAVLRPVFRGLRPALAGRPRCCVFHLLQC